MNSQAVFNNPIQKYIESDGLQCGIPCISAEWRRTEPLCTAPSAPPHKVLPPLGNASRSPSSLKMTLVPNGSVLGRSAEISPIAPNGWGQPTSTSGSADLKDLPMRSSRLAYELTSDLQQPTLKYIEPDGLQCVIPCISAEWRRTEPLCTAPSAPPHKVLPPLGNASRSLSSLNMTLVPNGLVLDFS